jgi:RNA polymerase sigma factor (TIGR02999 family)
LVHEAVLRLLQNGEIPAANGAHFLGIAARVMKQILVDRARTKDSSKRVAPLAVPMRYGPPIESDGMCVLALEEALERLRLLDSRQADIVEMRFFSGMTSEEVAQHMEVSLRTVNREWATARSWLRRELERADL